MAVGAGFAVPASDDPKRLHRLEAHDMGVLAVAFGRDGRHLVSGGADGHARLWNIDGDEVADIDAKSPVNSVGLAGDRLLFAFISWGGQMWDHQKGARIHYFESHAGASSCSVVLPDGSQFVSGTVDGSIRVCDIKSHAEVRIIPHGEPIDAVTVSADGKLTAAAGEKRVGIYETGTGKRLGSFETPKTSALAFYPDGERLAVAETGRTLRSVHWRSGRVTATDNLQSAPITAVVVAGDGRCITAGEDGGVVLRSADSSRNTAWSAHRAKIHALAVENRTHLLATGCADGTLSIWQLIGKDN
jgi:WD40 repeat protein